jgi:hypothetical protein
MSIVKRKDKNENSYFFNTSTGKRTSEAAYKRAKAAPLAKSKARSGRPSESVCSKYGKELKVKETSFAGKNLKNCVRPSKKDDSRKAMFANIASRKGK